MACARSPSRKAALCRLRLSVRLFPAQPVQHNQQDKGPRAAQDKCLPKRTVHSACFLSLRSRLRYTPCAKPKQECASACACQGCAQTRIPRSVFPWPVRHNKNCRRCKHRPTGDAGAIYSAVKLYSLCLGIRRADLCPGRQAVCDCSQSARSQPRLYQGNTAGCGRRGRFSLLLSPRMERKCRGF